MRPRESGEEPTPTVGADVEFRDSTSRFELDIEIRGRRIEVEIRISECRGGGRIGDDHHSPGGSAEPLRGARD